jgi:immune inhibitor A
MGPSNPSTANRNVIIAIVVVLCCLCTLILVFGGGVYYYVTRNLADFPYLPRPSDGTVAPEPTVQVNRPDVGSISRETEDSLGKVVIPQSDLYDLACRLKNICDVPHTLPAPSTPYKVGDKKQFWLSNSDTTKNFQVGTTLRYITPHSYFWLQDGVDANDADIKALMDAFETKIYPTDREFFGSEWTPGVDNDPHIYVLYVRGVGQSTGGYFSTPDEYNPAVFKYSNGHEQFVFNADGESLTDEYTYGTLAHEFQHMIHWNLDLNETSWINEGFSEVAAFLNGYSVGGADLVFAQNPDLPLTEWTSLSNDPDVTTAHYGEAYLFLTYFLDRFGDKVTQAVVKDKENSLESIDDTLRTLNVTDKQTGKVITADDVVMDWMAANYLHDGSAGDGRYTYHNYKDAPRVSATKTVDSCPASTVQGTISQYGADYIEVTCPGEHTLSFTGSTVARILPTDAHSGKYMFWSNKSDQSDMTLTREFDFSGATGALDMSYWTWYDLELGFDYLYLEASTDGQHWDIIKTTSCTDKDESGNAYGCGYNGKSGGGDQPAWINEHADLSSYAGKKVQLRFEYVTDAAVVEDGLLLDDVSIPAVNYSTDFEAGDDGWKGEGFSRIENTLPQTFRLSLILKGSGKTTVENVPVNPDQTANIPVSLQSGDSAVLILTGTQRFTSQAAGYTIDIK